MCLVSGEQLVLGGRNSYNQWRHIRRGRQRRKEDKRNLIHHPWSWRTAVEADGKLKIMLLSLLSSVSGRGEQSLIVGWSNTRAQQQPSSAGTWKSVKNIYIYMYPGEEKKWGGWTMAGEEDDSPTLTSLERHVKISQTRNNTGGLISARLGNV